MIENIDPSWIYGIVATSLLYFIFFYKSRSNRLLDKFPKPEEDHVPLLGILPFFLNCPRSELLPHMSGWREKHGPVIKLWSPFGSALMILEAKSAEKLFNSQTNITKGFDYDWVKPWLGDGLLLSTGKKWSHRRKMLTPAFHFKILEDFLQVFNSESQKMVKILKQTGSKQQIDIHHYVTRCALDIICLTAMGTSVNAQELHDSDYIQAINTFGRLTQDRSFRPWLRFEPLWRLSSMYKKQCQVLKVLHGFTSKVIAERKKEFLNERRANKLTAESGKEQKVVEEENVYFKSKKRLAFLDLLLEVQAEKGEQELSDVDIREETDTFMFEGHDTTSSNVSFTLYALGWYSEFQVKVHEELDAIFGDDKDRPITSQDLTRMKYLECVIKESLRIYPSVPFIQRKLDNDIVLDDGRTMPEGVTVGIFIYKIHKDPIAFSDPDKFNPDRFFSSLHDPYAFVPFSAGLRNCIGQKFAIMEEKVMIATILRHFKIKSITPPNELKLLSEMILRSENGLTVQLTAR